MKSIRVTFQTLTPLWTGDAWGESKEIRPSSIMGSLRFWFYVYCKSCAIPVEKLNDKGVPADNLDEYIKKYNSKESFESLLSKELMKDDVDYNTAISNVFEKINLPLISRVFGCTGWKGWVRIKRIEPIKDYCFGNRLNLPYAVYIKKKNRKIYTFESKDDYNKFLNSHYQRNRKEKQTKVKKDYSIWFFTHPYFWGEFMTIFEVEDQNLETLFYPLLTFIEKYGFLGGKWNIGYGRVKVEKLEEKENGNFKEIENWRKEEITFDDSNTKRISELVSEKNSFSQSTQSYEFVKFFLEVDSFYCSNERDFDNKISNLPSVVKIAELNNSFNSYKDAIIQLLQLKPKIRNCLRPDNSICNKELWHNFRHKLLGATSNDREGTKIIPWIYRDKNGDENNKNKKNNSKIKGGFISIAGLLNL